MNLLDMMGDSAPPAPKTPTRRSAPARALPAARWAGIYTPRPVRPMWRNGQPVTGSDIGYVVHRAGDLRWLTHAYTADGQQVGRWFRWSDSPEGWMWICIDPQDLTGINALPDTPPAEGRA